MGRLTLRVVFWRMMGAVGGYGSRDVGITGVYLLLQG